MKKFTIGFAESGVELRVDGALPLDLAHRHPEL